MRLITTDLITAFPQLDPFPIEQRKKFFKRAVPNWLSVAGRVLVWGLAIASCLAIIAFKPIDISSGANQSTPILGFRIDPLAVLIIIATSTACVVASIGLLIRDRLIVLRLKEILGTRGSCGHCYHPLLGLVVPDDLRVTCPECGELSEVDPSLCELRLPGNNSAGDHSHSLSPTAPTRVVARSDNGFVPWHRSAAIKLTTRWLLISVATIVITALGILIYEEVALRRVARFAKSQLVTYTSLTKGQHGRFLPATASSQAAWQTLIEHLEKPNTTYPRPSLILAAPTLAGWPATISPTMNAINNESRAQISPLIVARGEYWKPSPFTLSWLELYADASWHKRLMDLLEAVFPYARHLTVDDPDFAGHLGYRRNLLQHTLGHTLVAAIRAAEADDLAAFNQYFKSVIALERLLQDHPIMGLFNGFSHPPSLAAVHVLWSISEEKDSQPWLLALQSHLDLLPDPANFVDQTMAWSAANSHTYGFSYLAEMSNLRFRHGPFTSKVANIPSFLASMELQAVTIEESWKLNKYVLQNISPTLKRPIRLRAPAGLSSTAWQSRSDPYTQTLILTHLCIAHKLHILQHGTCTTDLRTLSIFSTKPALLLAASDWDLTLSFQPKLPLTGTPPSTSPPPSNALQPVMQWMITPPGSTPASSPESPTLEPLPPGHQQIYVHHAAGSIRFLSTASPAAAPASTPSSLLHPIRP
jgi:hypothetical protein